MSEPSTLLNEIISKLRDSTLGGHSNPGLVSNLFSLTDTLPRNPPSLEEFRIFLADAHDVFIKLDSSQRSTMLRAIRFALISPAHVKLLTADEIQWVIILSLEQDNESNTMERMQGLKLMDKARGLAPEHYPISFARSLVAIANSREDSFRKVCLDSLRELALVNPALVATVHGFSALLDAVIEPINQSDSDNITYTILFLLNDPITSKILAPCVDLKILLAPYTDLDSDPAELAPKWAAAKRALLIVMKSWVGIVLMTSDELALPMVVKTLTDPKIPSHTQAAILDLISAMFEPVVSKVQYGGRSHKQEPFSLPVRNAALGLSAPAVDYRILKGSSETELYTKDWSNNNRPVSAKDATTNLRHSSSASNMLRPRSGTAPSEAPPTATGVTSPATNTANNNRASTKFTLSSMITAPFRRPSNHGKSGLSAASNNSGASSMTSSQNNSTINLSAAGGAGPANPTNNTDKKRLSLFAPSPGSSTATSAANLQETSRASLPSLEALQQQDQQTSEVIEDFDPVYNLMDNYTALLACAFLHMQLLKSLFALGTEGNMNIASKSRQLMVSYLQILAYVLPEASCAELLTESLLMEMAVKVGNDPSMASTRAAMNKAHKSSQILIDIADAFSLMPCKQTAGAHISNLSASIPGIGSNSFGKGKSANSAQMNAVNQNAGSYLQKSNFVPLNIKTIYELAEEIKISSLTNIAATNHHHYRTIDSNKRSPATTSNAFTTNNHLLSPSFASVDILHNLRVTLQPVVDKADFSRQMDQSRVIGKEGKEPFKWDWQVISDMLEFSFSNSSERLAEALRTKWVRRVSGFYRCSIDDKGYFAHLEWEPTNLQYLECACNLYSVLLKDGESDQGVVSGQQGIGLQFLTNDRRGIIFNQIAAELELLINNANAVINAASGGSSAFTSKHRPSMVSSFAQQQQIMQQLQQKSVFRLWSCNCTMAREFFTLLGRIICHPNSKHLIEGTHIMQYFTRLSEHRSLDYLTRLVAVSLALHDGGKLSKGVIQFWAASKNNSSPELKRFLCNLLRILAQNLSAGEPPWSVDAILLMLMNDSSNNINNRGHRDVICKALVDLMHSRSMLRTVVSKRPSLRMLLDEPVLRDQLIRFLAIPEGIAYFQEPPQANDQGQGSLGVDWLENTIAAWQQQGGKCAEYVQQVEEKLSMALCHPSSVIQDEMLLTGLLQPIPIQTPELIKEQIARQGSSPHALGAAHSHQSGFIRSKNYNAALVADLRAFLRIPWNIEVKITGSQGGNDRERDPGANVASPGEYLKVDTFLDASDMSCPLSYESTSDLNRIFKVRGLLLDSRGNNITVPISSVASIHVTLMAGICPIDKEGRIESYTDHRPPPRRRSTTSSPLTVGGGGSSSSTSGINSGANRASIVTGNNNNNSTGNTMGSDSGSVVGDGGNNANESDLPVSLGIEQSFQWVSCRPFHRQIPTVGVHINHSIRELSDGRFAVIVPDNPVVLIFRRGGPASLPTTRVARSGSLGGNNTANYGNATVEQPVLLVEVQYYFRLETGYATFVPMPRHIYGELARSLEGCEHLARRNIIFDTVQRVHQGYDDLTRTSTAGSTNTISGMSSTMDLRANLWALAHIGSTEFGLQAILNIDPRFVEWCIEAVSHCAYFSVRGTFFHVLGLISRTFTGSRQLMQCRWDSAIIGSNSAVTIPRNPAKLFLKMASINPGNVATSQADGMRKATLSISRLSAAPVAPMPYLQMIGTNPPPNALKGLTPFIAPGSIPLEIEVLHLVSKMPGVILYRECKARLDAIKREHPEVFYNRQLFLDVLKVLDSYNFKLTARRDITALFTDHAKMKIPPMPSLVRSLSATSAEGNNADSPAMPCIRLAEQ